jgi:MFS family permease
VAPLGADARHVTDPARSVERTYLTLTLLTTLASSFIWGINTIFLLDAGLNNAEAFAANAFFTVGQVIFEVPTGVVADTRGRQFSYVLGAGTLILSTLLYLVMWQVHAPLWGWAIASILLGLGFTFFSGATEAWLVDALRATGFTGHLEHVFGRAQTVGGAAMLVGTVSGGVIAQATNLGVPYLVRAAILGVTVLYALRFMSDLGFEPQRGVNPATAVRNVVRGAIDGGFRNPPVRWLMLAAPFTFGSGIFVFYAAQPYLLELYGDKTAYGVAGLAAAIVAGVQILGGLIVSRVRRLFGRRTSALLIGGVLNVVLLALLGLTGSFPFALLMLAAWAFVFAVESPLRQAFVNGLIPSEQRATVLSFDALMGSAGGVIAQPALGRLADVNGYGAALVVSSGIQALALPFVLLARREHAVSDPIEREADAAMPETTQPRAPGHVPLDGELGFHEAHPPSGTADAGDPREPPASKQT